MKNHWTLLLLACLFSTLNAKGQLNVNTPQKGIILSAGWNFIDNCDCALKPKNKIPNNHRFAPALGFFFRPNKHLLLNPSISFFNNDRVATGVGSIGATAYYNEILHKTHNFSSEIIVGYALDQNNFTIIPNIGFIYFRRKHVQTEITQSIYYGIPFPSLILYPESAPDQIDVTTTNLNKSWNSYAMSIGVDCNVRLVENILCNLFIQYVYSPTEGNWNLSHEEQKILRLGFGVGWTFQYSKKSSSL